MSPNPSQEMIREIIDELYPQIDRQILAVCDENKKGVFNEKSEAVFTVFDELKYEFQSLSRYEIKLVYPAIKKFLEENNSITHSSYICLQELQLLIRKKEEHIKELALQLEVEAQQAGFKTSDLIFSLISSLQNAFILKKDAVHKLLLELQWNDAHFVNDNVAAADALLN